mgnify:FL=1
MTKKPTDLAYYLHQFLAEYLPGQRNVSSNTIQSYSTTYSLLLRYCREERGQAIERLCLDDMTAALLKDFLTWLESARGNAIATRNQRLTVMLSFDTSRWKLLCARWNASAFWQSRSNGAYARE